MKKLTKFQKQLIAIACLVLAFAVCLTVYLVRNGDEPEEIKPSYAFTGAELDAIKGFEGAAQFTFRDEKGKADSVAAAYMRLADGYASVNSAITVRYGEGDKTCVLTVNGAEYVPDDDKLFSALEDGTVYATDARAYFNTALFGSDLGAVTDALDGYDLDGDSVNSAGYAYLYGPIERSDIKYIYVKNQYDELTFVPIDGVFYLSDTDLDLATAVTATLVAAVRSPVASAKVANPGALAEYGLDSEENATASIIIEDKSGNAYYLRIGKAASDGSGYYAQCYGKDIVYILPSSISNYILIPKESFLVAEFGTPLDQLTDVYTKVDDITVGFEDEIFKAELMTETEKENHPINYSWKVTAPSRFASEAFGYALPSYGNIGDVFNTLCSLSTEDIAEADINEETLEQYGLATPYRTYSWLYEGETRCTVYFSEANADGSFYVYSVKEDVESGDKKTVGIGVVAASAFPYTEYTLMDYLDTNLYTQYFDKLDGMEYVLNGETYKITLKYNDEGTVESAKLNGKDADLSSCKNFYRGLLHCQVLDEYETDGDLPAEIFNIKVTSGGKTTEISFGRISAMKVLCIVDGKAMYTMDYGLYEILVSGAEKLAAGETVEW